MKIPQYIVMTETYDDGELTWTAFLNSAVYDTKKEAEAAMKKDKERELRKIGDMDEGDRVDVAEDDGFLEVSLGTEWCKRWSVVSLSKNVRKPS